MTNSTRHNLRLRLPALPIVRVAFIGLGYRGKQSLRHFLHLEGVEIKAVCDLYADNVRWANRLLCEFGKPQVAVYQGEEGWRGVCERSDIDLVYVCTSIRTHAQIAVYGMEQGKHVAVEVPIADSVADCWRIVDAAERHKRHCMMLENCCYGRFELAVLNMARKGLLGNVFHAEGSYIHDLHAIDFAQRPEYVRHWFKHGNPYPTHGLGPLCQVLNIHRGDRLRSLVSVSSGQFVQPTFTKNSPNERPVLGNINTTILKTELHKTIVLQNDISSPRPRERRYLLSGTAGFVDKLSSCKIQLSSGETSDELLARYDHPLWQELGETARQMDTHEGIDFMMDYRLVHCLRNGLPLDMDVYDAVEWSCLVELTSQSVRNGGMPVEIPDFTRGAWWEGVSM